MSEERDKLFDEWFDPDDNGNYQDCWNNSWKACAAIKDKRIKELEAYNATRTAEVLAATERTVVLAAENEALRDLLTLLLPVHLNLLYVEEASYGKNSSGARTDKAREYVAKIRKALATPSPTAEVLQKRDARVLQVAAKLISRDGGPKAQLLAMSALAAIGELEKS